MCDATVGFEDRIGPDEDIHNEFLRRMLAAGDRRGSLGLGGGRLAAGRPVWKCILTRRCACSHGSGFHRTAHCFPAVLDRNLARVALPKSAPAPRAIQPASNATGNHAIHCPRSATPPRGTRSGMKLTIPRSCATQHNQGPVGIGGAAQSAKERASGWEIEDRVS